MRGFRWIGALALTGALAAPLAAGAVTLHAAYAQGDCVAPTIETMDVPKGALSIHLHIANWSPSNFAGIPKWMAFQRFEPQQNGYTGFEAYLSGAAGPAFMRPISSKTTPPDPKAGGVLDYDEQDEVIAPFRMQVEIVGPTYHSGDGACHQGQMETWLTIDTGGAVAGAQGAATSSQAPSTASLSGTWMGNDRGAYEIRQHGDQLTWTGTSADGGRTFVNDFVGVIRGNMIVGHFKDRPTGIAHSEGDLQLRIVNDHRLEMVQPGGGFSGTVWTR